MNKRIVSIKFSENELKELDFKSKQSGLSRSEYMRKSIFNNTPVTVINKQKEFYQVLCNINRAIGSLEQKKVDCTEIRKEVMKACQLLNL